MICILATLGHYHDAIIKLKHFLHYWQFVWGIHQLLVNSPHKGQWHRALMFSLICVSINGWVNNPEAGDLICYRAHYDVTVMYSVDSLRFNAPEYFAAETKKNDCHFTRYIIRYIFLKKNHVIWFKSHASLFLRVILTISQRWIR